MINYSQPGYWPVNFWSNYWPGSPPTLVRTEPITYLPNSYYVNGYWTDRYWPLAYARIATGKLCLALAMTVPGVNILIEACGDDRNCG